MSYEILEHTADAKFRSEGDSKSEAFSGAVKAFGEIVGTDPGAGEYRHSIEIESENLESLLFDLMDELILLQDTENVAVCHAEDMEVEELDSGFRLEADVWVDPITKGMSLLDIKGPTYSEMSVDYVQNEGWVIEAVLDI